jgi:hypothetical protein
MAQQVHGMSDNATLAAKMLGGEDTGGDPDQQLDELEEALMEFCDVTYKDFSRSRVAEEREWMEAGLFYQRRQWLEWEDGKRKWKIQKQDKAKPRPMPVSNYFAKAVNANANAFDSPRIMATALDDDELTRRAAEYMERAKEAIDQESGMDFNNPLLSKHRTLWGMGVIKDVIDDAITQGVEQMPEFSDEDETTTQVGCYDCNETSQVDDPSQAQEGQCPNCQSMNTTGWYEDAEPQIAQMTDTQRKKITSSVVPIFEIFLPRDCANANFAPRLLHKYRLSIGKAKRIWGKKAQGVKAEERTDQNDVYQDALRSLLAYNHMMESSKDNITVMELWTDWSELPKKLQELIDETFADQQELIMKMHAYGIYVICSNGVMLSWGANPFVDPDSEEAYKPFTFFLWEVDPSSVYPKGLAADLIPLQKRLNRLDSLIELAMMTNAVGKWLWPSTQNNKKPPSGSPDEVAEYDPVGDAKLAPTFVNPQPFSGHVWQLRSALLEDFQEIGQTPGIEQGIGQHNQPFRAVAFLGAKADEARTTQRKLWETAHALRYRKLSCMAKLFWDDERKVKVAGHDGRWVVDAIDKESLRGSYDIDYVPNSSRPKALDEKMNDVSMMLQAGLVDPSDPSTREYILDEVNLEGLNLADDLQFRKSQRDLEKCKRGALNQIVESPYANWTIFLKVFANYTLTEEFEYLDPRIQTMILAYTEYLNQKVTEASMFQQTGGASALMGGGDEAQQMSAALSGQNDAAAQRQPNKTLSKVPGQSSSTGTTQAAAQSQGNAVAKQSMPN